ncbi:hypothetical protein HYV71_02615 [Candidatus Uhrbacteria bacterium]|nr:hypothetical protein [Candidatus Uhrbacteria bacterium]
MNSIRTIILLIALLMMASPSYAATLKEKLAGRILLQVEEKGKAWYVEPQTKQRAYLGRPADAFRIMRELSLGITDANLGRLKEDTPFACKNAGKIFLQVQQKGEAWYVFPPDCSVHYLGRPSDAFSLMRTKGLGISNDDIATIPASVKYTSDQQSRIVNKETSVENIETKKIVADEISSNEHAIEKIEEEVVKKETAVEDTSSANQETDLTKKKAKELLKKIEHITITPIEPIKLDIKLKSPDSVYIPPISSPELRADPLLPYYDSLSSF